MNKNILKDELIGMHIEISDAKNKSLMGLTGTIIDETKNTLKIQTNTKIKTILKNQVILKLGNLRVEGCELVGRSEERIKKK